MCVTRVIARLHTLNVLSKNFWTEYWPCSSRRGLQNEVDFCNSTFSNCTFFRFLEHCAVPSLSRKEHVSHGFSSDTLRKKGVAARVERMLESIKRGAEIDSCCDTTIQQATNFGTDASVNQLFARSSMEVVSWQENLPFSSITWLSLFYWCTTTSE